MSRPDPSYALPKRQFINATFVGLAASSTGQVPISNPIVVAERVDSVVPNTQKYFEIKVFFRQNTYYTYQNVATGGFLFVESAREGTVVTESTTATLWVKHVGPQFVRLSPAKDHDREDVYIKLRRDIVEEPLILSADELGTQWTIREVD